MLKLTGEMMDSEKATHALLDNDLVIYFGRSIDLPVDDEAHLHFSCSATAVVGRERRLPHLPITPLQDLMCCLEVYEVALFVHKCMKMQMQQLQLLPGNNLDETES
jgi:hypothetical protein